MVSTDDFMPLPECIYMLGLRAAVLRTRLQPFFAMHRSRGACKRKGLLHTWQRAALDQQRTILAQKYAA